jgi:hypothetical protein
MGSDSRVRKKVFALFAAGFLLFFQPVAVRAGELPLQGLVDEAL